MAFYFPTYYLDFLSAEENDCRKILSDSLSRDDQKTAAFVRGSLHAISLCRRMKSPSDLLDILFFYSKNIDAYSQTSWSGMLTRHWFFGVSTEFSIIHNQIASFLEE